MTRNTTVRRVWPGLFRRSAGGTLAVMATLANGLAHGHGFEERYDLPVPLSYVVAGALGTLVITFLLSFWMISKPIVTASKPVLVPIQGVLGRAAWAVARLGVWLLWLLAMACAAWGTGDPLMNLAPNLIWIVWWLGMSFTVMLFGDVWSRIDPWAFTFILASHLLGKLRQLRKVAPATQATPMTPTTRPWPASVGVWPAALLLLLWCALEVIYPIAATPSKVATLALAWTAVNFAGMSWWGVATWRRHGDVFAVYFSMLGRVAPKTLSAAYPAGQTAFITAMLANVLFDGLHGASIWLEWEQWCAHALRLKSAYATGGVGLVLLWLVLLGLFALTQALCVYLLRPAGQATVVFDLPPFEQTLLPIAAGYLIAHNFTHFAVQSQNLIALLSDPFGRQWDLFGTAKFAPRIDLISAQATWLVAVAAIVLGHMFSLVWAHKMALSCGLSPQRTARGTLPMLALMLAYTALSLWVIAQPTGN